MQGELSRRFYDMKWRDVSCMTGSWFVCERLQEWSAEQFQQRLLTVRRDLQHIVDKLADVKNQLGVPIGFIYVQLSGQPEPRNLWVGTQWEQITSQYAGLFFRAEGGGSVAFGSEQAQLTHPLTVSAGTISHINRNAVPVAVGTTSVAFSTGNIVPTGTSHWGIRCLLGAGEVRPRNSAIRTWRRTGWLHFQLGTWLWIFKALNETNHCNVVRK